MGTPASYYTIFYEDEDGFEISMKCADRQSAHDLVKDLRAEGRTVWIHKTLPSGKVMRAYRMPIRR